MLSGVVGGVLSMVAWADDWAWAPVPPPPPPVPGKALVAPVPAEDEAEDPLATGPQFLGLAAAATAATTARLGLMTALLMPGPCLEAIWCG